MRFSVPRASRWARLVAASLLLAAALVTTAPAFAASGPDYSIPSGWFFSQTGGGGGQGYAIRDTGTDSNGHTIAFWSEFQRLGGVATLGYPIGEPYVGSDGFTYQPFQRALLQWHPELDHAVLANTFQILQSANQDDWLFNVKGVPRPIADDGSGGNYQKAVSTRLGWLTNSAIKAKFLANPNPQSIGNWNQDVAIQFYGLPMSQPEQHGPFITQRFQRIAFQLWTDNVPGMPAPGTVVGILGGDLLKQAGQLPASAVQPLGAGGTAPALPPAAPAQPTATPAPAPAAQNWPWHSTYVNTAPNCGTTYIRAFTRDANGNGVNGMTLKSWNDYGNVYIASTQNANGQDGHWDRVIGGGPRAGTWYVELVDGSGNQASNVVTINFTANCDPNQGAAIQEVEVEFRPS
ncbi:MAG TPA: hypothetical protein VMW65_02285 [Chloroflexota bacterium]|nr:hypothetical protein [Chloroflexota bacterium]